MANKNDFMLTDILTFQVPPSLLKLLICVNLIKNYAIRARHSLAMTDTFNATSKESCNPVAVQKDYLNPKSRIKRGQGPRHSPKCFRRGKPGRDRA